MKAGGNRILERLSAKDDRTVPRVPALNRLLVFATAGKMLLGLVVAVAILAAVETLALVAEVAHPPGTSALSPRDVRAHLQVDPRSGELVPSFFEETLAGLRIRDVYTNADLCRPFHCQTIPNRQSPLEYRLGCFGGSTVNGIDLLGRVSGKGVDIDVRGWPGPSTFCDLVGDALADAWPQRHVVTINLGGDGFDSASLLPLMREVSRRVDLDLWLIYAGHNEFIYRHELVEAVTTPLQRLSRWCDTHLAIYRILSVLLDPLVTAAGGAVRRRYSDASWIEAAGFSQRYDQVVAGYVANLRDMVALGRSAGARVLVSELVYNLDRNIKPWNKEHPHFKAFSRGLTSDERAWVDSSLERLERLVQQGDCHGARTLHAAIRVRDPRFAAATYPLADCLLAVGKRAEALALYYEAAAAERLPAVITPDMNAALAAIVETGDAALARQRETFERLFLADPTGYAELFIDDCHPTAAGHRLIAKNIVAVLTGGGRPPP